MNPDKRQARRTGKALKPQRGNSDTRRDSETLVKVDSPDDFPYEGQSTSPNTPASQTTMSAPGLSQVSRAKRTGPLPNPSEKDTM